MSHADSQVQIAINESIREDRAVKLEAREDRQEWIDLAASLSVACEDYSEERTEDGLLRAFWGTDDDGDVWKIELLGTE